MFLSNQVLNYITIFLSSLVNSSKELQEIAQLQQQQRAEAELERRRECLVREFEESRKE